METDPSIAKLREGDFEGAWSLFLDRHRRLLFAVIGRYASDREDVMDLFAHTCEQLRADNLSRLSHYAAIQSPRATFSTWLVIVVRNLCVDWLRARDGRRRSSSPATLSALAQRIYERLFVQGYTHRETYELTMEELGPTRTEAAYYAALREVHECAVRDAPESWRKVVAASDARDDTAIVVDQVATDDRRRVLVDAMQALAPDVRLAVQLFVIEGLSAPAVARTLGWSNAKAVYNRVYRALAELRDTLLAQGIDADDL